MSTGKKAGRGSKKSDPVALGKERLLRELGSVVREHVAGDPAAEARLRKYLANELPAMKQDRAITIRIPGALVERINALAPVLAADPLVAAARGGRGGGMSAVVRLALIEGMKILEARHGR